MRYPLRRDVHFRFVGSDEELAAIPIVDDEVEVIVGSRSMAVAPWIEDEAILSLADRAAPRRLSGAGCFSSG